MPSTLMDDWTPEGGRIPFDAAALAWFLEHVRVELSKLQAARAGITDDDIEGVVAWYAATRARAEIACCVEWTPSDTYRGEDFVSGHWAIRKNLLDQSIRASLDEVRDARARVDDATRYTTLDAWLKADVAGTLKYIGDVGGSTVGGLVSDDVELAREHAAEARRARWPIACATCGESFRPDRGKVKHCPACRAQRRAPASAVTAKPRRRSSATTARP